MLKAKHKAKIVEDFRKHQKDTGSAEVQIGLISETIEKLTSHLKKNPKDDHSRRGLLKMVAKRKRLLNYVAKHNKRSYGTVMRKIGLKK